MQNDEKVNFFNLLCSLNLVEQRVRVILRSTASLKNWSSVRFLKRTSHSEVNAGVQVFHFLSDKYLYHNLLVIYRNTWVSYRLFKNMHEV